MDGRMNNDGASTLRESLTTTRRQVDSLPDGEVKELMAEVLRELGSFLDLKCTVPGCASDLRVQLRDSVVTAVDGDAGRRSIVTVTSSVWEDVVDEMQELLVTLRSQLRVLDVGEPTLSSVTVRVAIDRSDQLREHMIRALNHLEGSWPTETSEDVRRPLDEVVRHERTQLLDRQGRQMTQLARAGIDEIEDLVRQLRETVQNGKAAVAKLGEGELAEDFSRLARHEGWESRAWQGVVGVVLVYMAWRSSDLIAGVIELSWTQALQKLTVSVPLAALAAFAGAEARVHRHRGMWARSTAVQLRTVGAFTAILPDQERDKLRMVLGRRIFDEPAEPPRRRSGAPSTDVKVDAEVLGHA